MLEVPEKYRTMAKSDAREVSVKVMIGSVELTNDDIIELNIYRSLGENGFGIGGTVTTRVRLLCVMTLPYTGTVSMEVYVRFGFDDETASDYVQLGRFYGQVSNPTKKNTQIEIIGYDKLGSSGLSARCTFAAVDDASLTFPCTAQEMLEYVCARKNIETEIVCNDYAIPEMPVKDKTRDTTDYERYYTYGEIISFIAAAHGANAAIDSSGKLVFLSAKQSEEQVNASDCIDFSLTTAERFTVKGILLHVQDTLSTGSTNIFINDDSKEAYDGEIYEGVVEASCCFGSIEIAEALWGQLGGFAYNSCEFTRRGCGWTELGDVISATDDMRVDVYGKYVSRDIMVQTVEWSFSAANGFMEHIISKADSSEESAERLGSNNTINNSGGGVGEFTDEAKTSEIYNSYKDIKNESGAIVKKKNFINENTPYTHVAGYSNSVDLNGSNSEAASISGGSNNDIKNSSKAAIIGGQGNSISDSGISAILDGLGNSISGRYGAAILDGSGNSIVNSEYSTIVNGSVSSIDRSPYSIIAGGASHKIKNSSTYSAILGGTYNEHDGSIHSIINGGHDNKCQNCQHSAILDGTKNIISNTHYAAILSGENNSIDGGSNSSAILGGYNNSIKRSIDSVVLSGESNSINEGAYGASARNIVSGASNHVTSCMDTAVFGSKNRVYALRSAFVCGEGHKADDTRSSFGALICGHYGTLNSPSLDKTLLFVIGAGDSSTPKNVVYADDEGNLFAKSFNIIGAEAASVASEEAAQPSDISALAQQVSQMQAEIEALKSEIAQLKGAAS